MESKPEPMSEEEIEALRTGAVDEIEIGGVTRRTGMMAVPLRRLIATIDSLRADLEAARGALRGLLAEPYGCPFCDAGKLRTEGVPAKDHNTDCPYFVARALLAPPADQGEPSAECPRCKERGVRCGSHCGHDVYDALCPDGTCKGEDDIDAAYKSPSPAEALAEGFGPQPGPPPIGIDVAIEELQDAINWFDAGGVSTEEAYRKANIRLKDAVRSAIFNFREASKPRRGEGRGA